MIKKLNFQKKLILIAGPTASGKSKLASIIAKKINGEVINADSMQIYKEFTVLSSRPSKKEMKKIRHHLYGVLSVKEHFSTGKWLYLVKKKINLCVKNKKIPILIGGTGLYFNAITKGISKIPQIDRKIRENIRTLHNKIGQKKFYQKLILIDPISKNKILPTDTQRTIRAYEVKITTNKSIYECASNTRSDFLDFDIKKIFIDIPKDILLKNISKRTTSMIKNKCIEEVKRFLKLNIDRSLSANKIIGVREIELYLKKNINLDEVINLINIKTRQYAKRQKTWSKAHMIGWNMLYSDDFSVLTKKVLKVIS